MSAGAVGAAPRLCKEAGCARQVRSRGMCGAHYMAWHRDNPGIRQTILLDNMVEALLPASYGRIMEASGLSNHGVAASLKRLKAAGRAHIGGFLPPTTNGTGWKPVWEPGPGEDAKISKAQRREQRRKSMREAYARRQSNKNGWLGAIGIMSLGARACQK